MKGTGKPYGFPGLTQIGRAIEWAASKRAAPELESRIQRLEVCLNNIELAANIFNILNAGDYTQYNYNGANEQFNPNYLGMRNQQPARALQVTAVYRF